MRRCKLKYDIEEFKKIKHEMKYEEKIKAMSSAKKIPTESAQEN
jgi:hypothetical protein